jgi:hypothetical protein
VATAVAFEEILGRFQCVKRRGLYEAQALCPAHKDKKQSLSVTLGEDGRILMYCHAGCALEDVLAAAELTKQDLFPLRVDMNGLETIYDYVDENGCLLFQVVRKPGKKFCQRRPDGQGGWSYKLDGVRRIPYCLPEVIGSDPSQIVFVVEGEKDVENLRSLGEVATTKPGGVGNGKLWATSAFRDPLRGRAIVILPDNDEPGRQHAARVAQALHGHAGSVKVLTLPDLPAKGDISDWIQAGGTKEKLNGLVTTIEPWAPSAEGGNNAAGSERDPEKRDRPTQARLLVAIAQEQTELFKTTADEAYATTDRGETLTIRSKGFRTWLVGKFFQTYDKTFSAQAFKEAIDTLETLAALGTVTRTVALRVGEQAERLFLDLGNADRRIVEIRPGRWRVVAPDVPAIRFRRTATMRPLPLPSPDGDIESLRPFLNTGSEEWRWQLLLAWLLFTFQPAGPFPVLVLQGEQGCAKSTTARVLRALVDPSQAPLRLPPRDEDKLLVSAKSSWVLAFDNLSGMPSWLSDCLCCLATGTAQSKRALYTDDEEHIIEATRPVIVNGIDDMTARPDFASRALAVDLPQIKDERRQEESAFWDEFYRAQPIILGGLLSAVANILAVRKEIHLPCKPRMADFARCGVAAERVLGWPSGSFLAAYQTSQADSAAVTLESDLVALAVHRFMHDPKLDHTAWQDSATALLPRLVAQLDPGQDRNRTWPANASQLGNRLRRCAPILRRFGIGIEQIRSHGERSWSLTRKVLEDAGKRVSPPAPVREPEQILLLAADSQGDSNSLLTSPVRHPNDDEVTEGAGEVPATDGLAYRRRDDMGAGQDGDFSSCSEEETEGCAPESRPTPMGGRP